METLISCEGIDDVRIVIIVCIVWGKDLLVNTFPTRRHMAAVGNGRKVNSCLKNLHFTGLGSYSIPGINFFPHYPSKNTGTDTLGRLAGGRYLFPHKLSDDDQATANKGRNYYLPSLPPSHPLSFPLFSGYIRTV